MEQLELDKEKKYLKNTLEEISNQINILKEGMEVEETSLNEFNRYIFNRSPFSFFV